MHPPLYTLFTIFSAASTLALVTPHRIIDDNTTLTLQKRADLVVQPVCNGGDLSAHDCNVALLGLGGGIAGTIEFLRVYALTSSSTSGGCTMTVNVVNGGTAIDISKGRLEQAQKAAIAACGTQAWSVTAVGGATGGDLQIVQSAA